MGDHRFSFKAEFEMHGIKDKLDLDWCNWNGDGHDIDLRITDWVRSVASRAFVKYDADVAAYFEKERRLQTEQSERAELERLKAKYPEGLDG